MEVLRKLIEENTPPSTESKDVTDSSKETSSTLTSSNDETQSAPSIVGGKLLLFGSIDWENASSKSCEGLPSPHLINFHIPVLKTFSSSSSKYFFILLLDGTLYGMGSNDSGQLGTGDSISYNSPVLINQSWNTSSSLIQKISTGRSHTIFLHENGEIYGCGSNSCGQLGMGTIDNQLYPSRIPLNDIRDIACGYDHSLVCTRSGQLYAFGHPEYGQLGDGKTGEYIQQSQKVLYNYVTKPKLVQRFITKDQRGDIIRTVTDQDIRIRCVSAGRNHSCCLEDWEDEEGNEVPNRVYSWGFGGYGRLGHSSASDEHIPREISVFSPVQGRPHFPQKQVKYSSIFPKFSIDKATLLWVNLFFIHIESK